MLPKSSKHYLVPTTEDMGVDITLVEDAVSFFYSEVKASLTSLKYPSIKVDNLGSFKVKKKDIYKMRTKYDAIAQNTKLKDVIIEDAINRREQADHIINMLQEEYQRRKEFLNKKYNE